VGEDHGQGDLAVAEIVADALAHRLGVGRIVDRVVDQLEGDAEIASIGVERVLDRLVTLGDNRRDPAGGGEQGGGLGADDAEIMVFAGLDAALRGELVDLASAITAEARDRMRSTLRLPSSTISSKLRLNRKSPTSTLAGLPQIMLAVRLPRRRPEPSTTSSWRRVAVWINSTAAASL
jgi:hypothetical protein